MAALPHLSARTPSPDHRDADRSTYRLIAFFTTRMKSERRRARKLAKKFVAALLAIGIAVPHAHAFVDPVTCAVVAGAVISAMNKPHDINGARIEEILNQLSALGYSVETIQSGLAELLVRTQDLERKMTVSATRAAEGMALRAVVARAETLKGLMAEAKAYGGNTFKDGGPKWPSYRADIRRFALELRQDRQQLVMMPVTNIPGLILSTYVEMAANQAAEFGEGNAEVLRLATAQLERTVDEKPDSLPALIAARREHLAKTEAEIAGLLGMAGPKIAAGVWPWFTHTLMRQDQHEPSCRTVGRYDGGHESCRTPPPTNVSIHTRSWSRKVDVHPADGGSADLYTITVAAVPPTQEMPGGVPGATPHFNADQAFEDAISADKTLAKAIERHRAEVKAVVELERLEGLVRRTLANLAVTGSDPGMWSTDDTLALVGQASAALADVDTVAARQTTQAHLDAIDKSQKNRRQIEQEGRERVAALIRENRSKAWMADVQLGLQLYVATAPLVAEFVSSHSASATSAKGFDDALRKPELGETAVNKPIAFGLGMAGTSSGGGSKVATVSLSPLDPVRLGDSVERLAARFSLLGPGAGRAYGLGLGRPETPDSVPGPDAESAGLKGALFPKRNFPAADGFDATIAMARAQAQAGRFWYVRDLGGLVDPVKLYRGLLGDKGAEGFFKREIAPRQERLDDTLTAYQAKMIAGTLMAGDRDRLLLDVADQYQRLEARQRMIGLKVVDETWRAENVVAQDLVRGIELPASLMRTEQQHSRLVDKVYRELLEHPSGTYGSPSRDEVDWQIRYGGRLLPPPPHPVETRSR